MLVHRPSSPRRASVIALVLLCSACRASEREKLPAAPATSARTIAASPDLGVLALGTGDASSAGDGRLRALIERARLLPHADESFLLLGRAWIRRARETGDAGYYLQADACAKLVLERNPTSTAAQNLAGLVALNQHEFGRAKAISEAIVARDARDPTAWGTLSDAALELGDFETAVLAVDRMLELKPGLPAFTRTSYLRWLRGDEAGALEASRLAVDAGLDPSDPEPLAWVLVQAAELFFQRGDYAGADAGYSQALEVMAGYPPALVGRARVLLTKDQPKAAGVLLQQAFAARPLVETGSLLVRALTAAGDAIGAERAYVAAEREGLRGDRRGLAIMDSTLRRSPVRALELAEHERARRGDIYAEDALAWALYRNGRFERALASIERARRLGTRDARLFFHHGAILMAVGRHAEGRALVRRALALSPRFEPEAAEEAARLLEGRM